MHTDDSGTQKSLLRKLLATFEQPPAEVDGNRLDNFNPSEFRKGMDYELTAVGCSRLAESTEDERRKATENVLKNLEEHGGYYTSLITYETQFRNEIEGIKKPSFKTWLAEQGENQMKEVGKKGAEFKNDKMTELKEAIKTEVKSILEESNSVDSKSHKKDRLSKRKSMSDFAKNDKDFDGPSDDDTDIKASKGAKGKEKALKALDKEVEKLNSEKSVNVNDALQDILNLQCGENVKVVEKINNNDYLNYLKTN